MVVRGGPGRPEGGERDVSRRAATAQGALALGALGVVFGDIGTSPLYTVQTVFNPREPHPVTVTAGSVYGVVSLIFWSVMIIVT
ncbi:MAG: KUP/HAK/KT family potassium transporter, partial [Gemmatimonadota bacterium]